jgi:hypothetical protein
MPLDHAAVGVHAKHCEVPVSESDFRILGRTTGVAELQILVLILNKNLD